MMTAPTRPQNSISVCQSRPLRARREASIAKTAPARPSQIAARRRSKPGRLTPEPRTPEIIIDDYDVLPAQLPRTFLKAVLTSPAFVIVQHLVSGGLTNVDEGAARQVIRRDLGHR